MFVSKRQFVFIAFLVFALFVGPLSAQEADKTDTRILIDISGSMKQNDPKNLRRSALRLLVGLMPPGNRAGVWTFAQYTNMLVPLGVINDSWKRKARMVSKRIASPGQFTNIEDVLKRSTDDWEKVSPQYRKNIILLTDGMVDVSKDKNKNAASRKRILEELGPKIKALGGQIHTIALSDRADHDLMKTLSEMTGGWYEQVNSAEELQRVFLRMFEKVGKPDSVPLRGNKFKLDNSIDEATLLVFTGESQEPAKIMTPGGKIFDATKQPSNVSWHQDEGYNLITIKKPESGEWTIQADMDPDNRVMVVTNLKMKTTDIPNRLIFGEIVPVSVHFTEKGKQLKDQKFLEVVQVSASQVRAGEETEARPLNDDGVAPDETAGDGKFSLKLGEDLSEGKVELVINADGKTFVRERRQTVQIIEPAKLRIEDSAEATAAGLILRIDDEVIDIGSLKVEAWLENDAGMQSAIEMTRTPDGMFEAVVDKQTLVGQHSIVVSAVGKTLTGNDFNYKPEAVVVTGLSEPKPEPSPEPESLPEAEPKPEPKAESKPVTQAEPEPEEESSMLVIGLAIGLGNLVLIGLGVGVWLFLRKRSADEDALMFGEDDELAGEEKKNKKPRKSDVDPDETIDISPEGEK